MALKPLKVVISGDTTRLENALGRAGRSLAGLGVAAGAAGALVTGAIAAMTVQGLRAVDANTKLARSMDATVNGLKAVQLAAGYAGVSVGDANSSMQKMNAELIRAREKGTPAYDALRKIGMAAEDLAGLDADERMAAIADRMRQLGLSAGQASDILRDLGVRSRDMALLMLQGGDAIRAAREEVAAFGLELTETQTAGIEAANDALARMGLAFEGLRNRLAAEVAPALQAVADRFNQFAQSQAAQDAIERLVEAFGALAQTLLSEDFIGVATSALSGLADVAVFTAEAMVTFSQNIELVTVAFGGLAVAIALAGGPLSAVVALLGAALGGIAMWRARAEDAAEGSKTAATAQEELNKALGVFSQTAAPSAGKAAIDLANDNYKLAASAVAAAEAEIAKRQAILDAEATRVEAFNAAGGDENGYLTTGTTLGASVDVSQAQAGLEAAKARLDEARRGLDRAAKTVMGADYGGVTIPQAEIEPIDLGTLFSIPDIGGGGGVAAGLGSSSALSDELERRLEVLQTGLMTERETVDLWYSEGLDVLKNAREAEMLTEKEYQDARERLEKEHQERLAGIREAGNSAAFSSIVGAGKTILQAIGQTNSKAAKAAKALGAFEAMVNAYRAAAQALADPKLPWFAKASAAASVLATGIGFANSIRGMSETGSGGGGSGGGGGGGSFGGSASDAGASPSQTIYVNLQGDTFSRTAVSSLLGEVSALQSDYDRGARIIIE